MINFQHYMSHNSELIRMTAAELNLLTAEFTEGVLTLDEYRNSVIEILANKRVLDFIQNDEDKVEHLKIFQQLMQQIKCKFNIL